LLLAYLHFPLVPQLSNGYLIVEAVDYMVFYCFFFAYFVGEFLGDFLNSAFENNTYFWALDENKYILV